MANTFLAAEGFDLGASLYEPDRVELAKQILERAKSQGIEVILPVDLVVTDDLGNPQRIETVAANAVPAGTKAVDVGPGTRQAFAAAIGRARTLFWNGPLGVFEKPPFDAGTRAVAEALAALSRVLGDRRRRDRGGRASGGRCRPRRARLDGRRRLAGAAGGQGAPRRRVLELPETSS